MGNASFVVWKPSMPNKPKNYIMLFSFYPLFLWWLREYICIYILAIITREVGKVKTYIPPTYRLMDNGENKLNLTHSTKYIWQAFYIIGLVIQCQHQCAYVTTANTYIWQVANLSGGHICLFCEIKYTQQVSPPIISGIRSIPHRTTYIP